MHVPSIWSNTKHFLTSLRCNFYDTQCHTVRQHEKARHGCIYRYSTWTPLGMLHLSRYPCHTISLSTLFTASWHVLRQVTVDTRHLLRESQRLNSMGVRRTKHWADSVVPNVQSTYGEIGMDFCMEHQQCGPAAVASSHAHTHTHTVNKVGRDKIWQTLGELKLPLRHPPHNKDSSYWTPADKLDIMIRVTNRCHFLL